MSIWTALVILLATSLATFGGLLLIEKVLGIKDPLEQEDSKT